MEIIALNLFFKNPSMSHVGLSQVSLQHCWIILDNFWYSLERVQYVFLAAWESLSLKGEDSWGLWVSIPGIPLKISVLQKYQYSFIPGSQTHNITCSSFFLLSSTSVLEWQLLSFNFTQGKKRIITHIDDKNIKAPVCKMIQEKWRISSYVHFATH